MPGIRRLRATSMHSRYRESPRSSSPRARASSAWPEIPATLQPIVRSVCSPAAIRSSSSAASSSLPALRSASAMTLRSWMASSAAPSASITGSDSRA